jgi:hypothetical protein
LPPPAAMLDVMVCGSMLTSRAFVWLTTHAGNATYR